MGKEQLWDDVSEEPLEYAGFVATKVWRIWSHGPREVMREPLWEALHWALVALGLLGLRPRLAAALGGAAARHVFLAITALSALLVASPRRVLVLVPLLARPGRRRHRLVARSIGAFEPIGTTTRQRDCGCPDSLSRP